MGGVCFEAKVGGRKRRDKIIVPMNKHGGEDEVHNHKATVVVVVKV